MVFREIEKLLKYKKNFLGKRLRVILKYLKISSNSTYHERADESYILNISGIA